MTLGALRSAEVLSELDNETLEAIAACCSSRRYEPGDTVWRAGDVSDELLVIESGELEIWGASSDGGLELIARAGPGECVGEMGLLLDERRSATVTCGRTATVITLDRASFQRAIDDRRAIGRLAELVSRRLVTLTQRPRLQRRHQIVCVIADDGVSGSSLVAEAIVDVARTDLQHTTVLLRPRPRGRRSEGAAAAAAASAEHGGDVVHLAPGEPLPRVVSALHGALAAHHVAVIDAGAGVGVEEALACADLVVRVTSEPADAEDRVLNVVNRYGGTSTPLDVSACEPFVLPVGDVGAVLGRLTRKIFGVTVGLALGGGAAFGISHVGVLLAFEEAGIPVDLLAGTSFGSIVAVASASGMPASQMVDHARHLGNVRTVLSAMDPVGNGSGLLGGKRLMRIFSPLIAQKDFAELSKPCRVIATDIDTGDRVDIGAGSIDLAVRASCSIPLIFSPVVIAGRTLVDGGMIDPVPADVAREMGADIVVGVNVVPRLESGTSTALSRVLRQVNRINPFSYIGGARGLPDAIDVLMKTLQVIQYELGAVRALAADVEVDLDLAGFTWIDFHRALDLIERGRKAGEAAVPAVQAAIAERQSSA